MHFGVYMPTNTTSNYSEVNDVRPLMKSSCVPCLYSVLEISSLSFSSVCSSFLLQMFISFLFGHCKPTLFLFLSIFYVLLPFFSPSFPFNRLTSSKWLCRWSMWLLDVLWPKTFVHIMCLKALKCFHQCVVLLI